MHFTTYFITAVGFRSLAAAAAGPPALLFNTYENKVHACISDCWKAAQQVCADGLSKPTEIVPSQPPAIFLHATVGNCTARYLNANYNETGFTTKDECESEFSNLIRLTGPPIYDSTCSLRMGGIQGNDADGIPTGQPVFAYFPVDTPTDGFERSLDRVPARGRAVVPDTLYGVSQSRCRNSDSAPSSDGLSSRGLAVVSKDVALYERDATNTALACTGLGVGAGATALCVYLVSIGAVVSFGVLGALGSPWCLGLAWLSGIAHAACIFEAVGLVINKPTAHILVSGSNATFNATSDRGRRFRIREPSSVNIPRLDRRITTESNAEYCNTTALGNFKKVDTCVVDAVARNCGIKQV